ncbi:hypothetical protein OFC62_27795, partial [Escherichia coli]|nr:hypothetical protein [Escherichia coli]
CALSLSEREELTLLTFGSKGWSSWPAFFVYISPKPSSIASPYHNNTHYPLALMRIIIDNELIETNTIE